MTTGTFLLFAWMWALGGCLVAQLNRGMKNPLLRFVVAFAWPVSLPITLAIVILGLDGDGDAR